MNFKQYMEQRNELMNVAEGLINEGKVKESEAKMQEVKDLDNKWEGVKVANANLNALKDNQKATNIENKSEGIEGGQIVGEFKETVKDDAEIDETAWDKKD